MKHSLHLLLCCFLGATSLFARNHIVMIMVDDLNDFVEPLAIKNPDGSPKPGNIVAHTPNMTALAQNGVLFRNAHSNSPVCNPSRSSMMHGVLPSTARFYGFEERTANPVFGGTTTLPKLMNTVDPNDPVVGANPQGAYRTFFTGKTFHVNAPFEYERTNGIKPSQVPLPYSLSQQSVVMHPDYPLNNVIIDGKNFFEAMGNLDCMYGSLDSLSSDPDMFWYRSNKDGLNRYAADLNNPSTKFQDYFPDFATMTNVYDPAKANLFYYVNDNERDLMTDELSARYLRVAIEDHFGNNGQKHRPIFMAFGIMNPHTPLIAPKAFFDMYPLEDLDLTFLSNNDQSGIADPTHDGGRGNTIYRYLREAYNNDAGESDKLLELKKYLQAYLACTSYADYIIGEVVSYLETKIDPNTGNPMIDDTTIILFADHGYHMGQKEHAWKYTMWDDSTRVPLIISDPRYPATHGTAVDLPVSLVDIYPTVVELGDMEFALPNHVTSEFGQPLDGTSLVPFLEDAGTTQEEWGGLPMALSMADIYSSDTPRDQVAAVRSEHFRYIRYGSAKDVNGNYLYEEFYDYRNDPLELNNIIFDPVLYPQYEIEINRHRVQMDALLSDDPTPPWEFPFPGEQFLAGFHTFQDSTPATAVTNRAANDTIDSNLLVSVSHGPSNSLSTENLLTVMTSEFSGDTTYGDNYPLLSATGPVQSSISMDGRTENYLLFKFENQSARTFRLTSLHFDMKAFNASFVNSFLISTVDDPNLLLGNGLAPRNTSYASVITSGSVGNGQFDPVVLSLAAVPRDDRTLDPGETAYFMLTVLANGFGSQADAYLDNIGWIGSEANLPLAITQQPAATTSLDGDTATIAADARGDNLQFQWYKGSSGDTSTPIAGQTTRILEIDLVSEADEGNYWVRVFNNSESADSVAAALSVDHPIASDPLVLTGWHTPATLTGQFSVGANSGSPEIAHLGDPDVECIASNGRRAGTRSQDNSTDNSFGTLSMTDLGISPPTSDVSFEFDRGNLSNRYKLDLALTNNRSDTITLKSINFDYRRDSASSSNVMQLIYTGGDLAGVSPNTILATLTDLAPATWHDVDVALNNLADRTLAPGETATFQLNIGFEGVVQAGNPVFADNLAFIGTHPLGNGPTPPGVTAFQQWIALFNTGGLSGEDDDPDFDRLTNLTEFAFDGNPVDGLPPAAMPVLLLDGVNFNFQFTTETNALRYKVQQSSDLIHWTDKQEFIPSTLRAGDLQEAFFLNTGDPSYLRVVVTY
jgi:arylsulfatase A-like enzyme